MYLLRLHSFALQVHEGSLLGPRVLLQGRVLLDMVLPVPLRSVRFGLGQRDSLLLQMATNPTAPGYGYLVSEMNLTTWPETWSAGVVAGAASLMHGTLNGFGLWFPQGLLGVQPTDVPGRLDVRPAYAVGLGHASGVVATPLGAVEVSWSAAAGGGDAGVALNLTVPFNTVLQVWIPAVSAAHVAEGGALASAAARLGQGRVSIF